MGSALNGEGFDDWFGTGVALSSNGTRVAIGAPYNRGNGVPYSGQVRVYDWTESQWTQVGSDLNGDDSSSLGASVSLSSDGTRVAIGAISGNGKDYNYGFDSTGQVRVYDWTGSKWKQVGSDLNGEGALDKFGSSVALSSDGTRVAIGAPFNNGNGYYAGQVRVYDWTGGQWKQVGSDLNGEANSNFGCIVAISSDGTRLAIHGSRGYTVYKRGQIRLYD